MEDQRKQRANMWGWLKSRIIGDVPPEDAVCEYDCRKPQCADGEWDNCERRLSGAAGELWPGTKAPSSQTSLKK